MRFGFSVLSWYLLWFAWPSAKIISFSRFAVFLSGALRSTAHSNLFINHQSSIISHIILPRMPTMNGAHPHVGLPHHLPLLHALDSIWQSAWYYCYDTWVIVIKKESILDLGSTCTRKKRWKLFQKYPITPLTFYQSLDCMYRVVMTDFGSMAPMVAEIEPNMTIVWGNGPG